SAGRGRADWIIADLGVPLRMRIHARAKMTRHHLRAEANTQEWLFLAQRDPDPVGFGLEKVVGVVGALRPAKDRGAGMIVHRLRQRVAKSRPADIERIAELRQGLTDPAGRRVLLMNDNKDW